ncbi:hypothetical protein LguiA_004206 [Lonicera macranthoides]
MATLQQDPITFQSHWPPSTKIIAGKPLRLSFSSSLSSVKLPKLTTKLLGKSSGRFRMAESAAGNYAKAVADIAMSNGTLETTADDIDKVAKVFAEPGVLDFFASPIIDVEKKREMIDEISKSANLQPHVENFLNVLIDSRRIEIIEDIFKEFELVYNKLTDTEMAIVSSVVKLESQHLAKIAKRVQKLTGAKNVRIKAVIDPSLLAGFMIRYGSSGSKLIDMSVKKQIEEISAEFKLDDIQLAAGV